MVDTDRSVVDRALAISLTALSLIIGTVLVKREFFSSVQSERVSFQQVDNWSQLAGAGAKLGAENASLHIVEFGDLQCPACKQFHEMFRKVEARQPGQLALTFVHYPLSYHKAARPAAVAAVCAARQGAFSRFVDLAYEHQDSLTEARVVDLAYEAGVRDSVRFHECVGSDAAQRDVETQRNLGSTIGVQGTPTLVFNGYKLRGVPPESLLHAMVNATKQGKDVATVLRQAYR